MMQNLLCKSYIKNNICLLFVLIILFLATYKYVAYPQPYTFETPWFEDGLNHRRVHSPMFASLQTFP